MNEGWIGLSDYGNSSRDEERVGQVTMATVGLGGAATMFTMVTCICNVPLCEALSPKHHLHDSVTARLHLPCNDY